MGLPALLGPAGRQRDLALALVISRVVQPGSKLSTLAWWDDTTLGADLGAAGATTDDIYAAMDWLVSRQDAIEAGLARRHLGPEPNPSRMALSGLSSSWLEGRCCPLAARGYSRDGKKGTLQMPNFVWNPAIRSAAGTYIAALTTAMSQQLEVDYYRIGLSPSGEMFLPYTSSNQWWAWDSLAQGDGSGCPRASGPTPPPAGSRGRLRTAVSR